MNKTAVCALILLAALSCSRKEKFAEPEYIMKKWAEAVKELNFRKYSQCEANPKDNAVFREMYSKFYYADLMVTGIEEPNEEEIYIDGRGVKFIKSSVDFEAQQTDRKSGKPQSLVRGDVLFVRFLEDEDKSRGWLMSNRTIYRLEK